MVGSDEPVIFLEEIEMKVFGVGRFVADPVVHKVNDTQVCKFSLAVNEYRKVNGERKKYPHFFDFECWDKAAEVINKWRHKGDLIEFYGTARQQKWNDKETGDPRSKIVFRMDDFTFLPRGNPVAPEDNGEFEEVEKEVEEDAEVGF
jgi:single-strand DNA-binding protein